MAEHKIQKQIEQPSQDFQLFLEYLKRSRGFDFTGYKSSSVTRRVTKRMQSVGARTYADYIDYLEVHPGEFEYLFNTILINVTSFFRDPLSWDYIVSDIAPRILAGKGEDEPIRIWCAGCASGEEAYTLAVIFAELLGLEQFRNRVKIYATDIDEEALNEARLATYTQKQVAGMATPLLEKYFESASQNFIFPKDLRRALIFGRHDLIQDAPISRIDLLTCRNTLMYFNSETQSRVLTRFHFALKEGGFLFLGKAEMLFTHSSAFVPVDMRRRVFTKVSKKIGRDRLLTMGQTGDENAVNKDHNHEIMRDTAFESSPVAQMVVDTAGTIVLLNERLRHMFSLSSRDIGKPLRDLELSYRPFDLRRTVVIREVEWRSLEGPRILDIQVNPLFDAAGIRVGAMVNFTDITHFKKLQADVEETNQELEAAYEELQSTSEELETTNEELQSTVEELETTNEELQSTNQELETMNEEVQSTNEELQTINDELRMRSEELGHVNSFMNSILTSLRGGVVVVSKDLQIRAWNPRAEDLWGLRSDEVVGKHFLNLDIGLPVEELKKSIRGCLNGESEHTEVVLHSTNRRGRAIQCKITCSPLIGPDAAPEGAILVMEEVNE
jgi:two-component system CheB/CheR fusion protein